ncbi:MAG: helicase-exonuclease AddAB subunit AddA [Clostridia bacterium]|nr:helicase-exonuclease AddAB subunit AddA [Clostridia bacterium]
MEFTSEQKDAIYKKGSNILVAAAAGSGKTAVLVERIIQKILKDGIDIDKLLVVTFTNAAASEMRERVLDAIYKKLDEEPDNMNLQRQVNLIARANICTIHSFCLDVIKNNFFKIDVSPNFRIGADEEITLMKQEVLENLFEQKYDEEDKDFLKLVEAYSEYRGDENLQDLVMRIYSFASSAAFPKDWIYEKVEMFNPKTYQENDFSKTIWGKILTKELREATTAAKDNVKSALEAALKYEELSLYTAVLEETLENLRTFYEKLNTSWDEAFQYYYQVKMFPDWPRNSKITLEAKELAKELRDTGRDKLADKVKKYLTYDSSSAFRDIFEMYEILKALGNLVIDFENAFQKEKKEKNLIDFNDIEHYALNILIEKDESGNYIPTDVAQSYQNKFEEIAIDEYQDSNNVQEQILTSISRGNNIFTVGDVKQSIYRFRRACPELFLSKYHGYSLDGNEKGLKIQLFKNFRSRKNILDITNSIFESIMTEELGEIDYTEEEFLNLGASYEDNENTVTKSEICVIDNNLDESEEVDDNSDEIDEENPNTNKALEEMRDLKKEELEAKLVAKKIKELMSPGVLINDKKEGMRPLKWKDIVILLRATKFANIYEKELIKNGIPVFTDGSDEYLDTIEIQTMMNLLKVLDNSLDDIAVVTVLRSTIFGFTDNEIIEMRLVNRDVYFWNSLLQAKEELENESLKEKLNNFLDKIAEWKEEKDYLPISELIWKIYVETGFYNYVSLMQNGSVRQANLKMLFERAKEYEKTSFKGLFNFIRFIEKLKSGNSDLSSAKIIGENEDVVRIMSIHKSKGLEFPIVFLSNTSKKMNTQDMQGDILLHKDLGFGPKYLNLDMKLEYPTYAKEAMKIKLKDEAISEEMRILYVALTRAREKLIITAIRKNEEKEIENKKKDLQIYIDEKKISKNLLKKKNSYLDWIEYVILNQEIQGRKYENLDFSIIEAKELLKENEDQEEKQKIDFSEYDDFEKLEEKLNWKYEDDFLTNLPIKTTVTTLKQLENEGVDFFALSNRDTGLKEIVPEFLQEEKVTSARIGTLTHLVLQKIDFTKIQSEEDIKKFIQELVAKSFMKEEESKRISSKRIYQFLTSDFALRIKQARKVYKERPFCIKVESSEVFKEEEAKGEMLVQGIIDMYYEKVDGNLVLVDYKTDYVENEETELVDKYKVQLELYKKALEEGTGKKVDEVYIYSLYLNKEIKL